MTYKLYINSINLYKKIELFDATSAQGKIHIKYFAPPPFNDRLTNDFEYRRDN